MITDEEVLMEMAFNQLHERNRREMDLHDMLPPELRQFAMESPVLIPSGYMMNFYCAFGLHEAIARLNAVIARELAIERVSRPTLA